MNEVLKPQNTESIGKWFSVQVQAAHLGAGKTADMVNYVFATNLLDALDKAKGMRGWKRGLVGKRPFPNIRELTEEEVIDLEEVIRHTSNVRMSQAKKGGFYGTRT